MLGRNRRDVQCKGIKHKESTTAHPLVLHPCGGALRARAGMIPLCCGTRSLQGHATMPLGLCNCCMQRPFTPTSSIFKILEGYEHSCLLCNPYMMAVHVMCPCSLSVNVVLLVRWEKVRIFVVHLLFSVKLLYDIYSRMEAELGSDSPSWWGGFRVLFKRLVSRCYRLKLRARCWNLFSLEHKRSATAQIPRTSKVRGSVVRVLKSPKQSLFAVCIWHFIEVRSAICVGFERRYLCWSVLKVAAI